MNVVFVYVSILDVLTYAYILLPGFVYRNVTDSQKSQWSEPGTLNRNIENILECKNHLK